MPYCFSAEMCISIGASWEEAEKSGMGVLIRLLKKRYHYNSFEMNKELEDAIKSIKCDGYHATIVLFGKTLDMSSPYQKGIICCRLM